MNDIVSVSDRILMKKAFEKDVLPKRKEEMNAEEIINHLKDAMKIKESNE